jgi:hypothetical protein
VRLDQRHAGLEQRRQFLVEHEKLARRNPLAPRHGQREPGKQVRRLQRDDAQPFLLEIVPQRRLGVGHMELFDDFAGLRSHPAAILHRNPWRIR